MTFEEIKKNKLTGFFGYAKYPCDNNWIAIFKNGVYICAVDSKLLGVTYVPNRFGDNAQCYGEISFSNSPEDIGKLVEYEDIKKKNGIYENSNMSHKFLVIERIVVACFIFDDFNCVQRNLPPEEIMGHLKNHYGGWKFSDITITLRTK